MIMQDSELVRAAQCGDAASFGLLYERHFDAIYAFLRRSARSADVAEDLTAQVFLKALEALHSYSDVGVPFAAWLFRIARNALVDHVRRDHVRQSQPLPDALEDRRPMADPERLVEDKLCLHWIVVELERMTEAQRQVIALRFVGGLSSAEVASRLGRSVGAVKALQHNAVSVLRRRQQAEEQRCLAARR